MNDHGSPPTPDPAVPDPATLEPGPDRPPSRAERRAETAHVLTVLSEALATQIDRLATSTDPAPDGWWFVPKRAGQDSTGY